MVSVLATCPSNDCSLSTRVNPSTLTGSITKKATSWKRCGNTVIGGYNKITENPVGKNIVYYDGAVSSEWSLWAHNGARWNSTSDEKGPNGTIAAVFNSAGNQAFFSRNNNNVNNLNPGLFTHLKITIKLGQEFGK